MNFLYFTPSSSLKQPVLHHQNSKRIRSSFMSGFISSSPKRATLYKTICMFQMRLFYYPNNQSWNHGATIVNFLRSGVRHRLEQFSLRKINRIHITVDSCQIQRIRWLIWNKIGVDSEIKFNSKQRLFFNLRPMAQFSRPHQSRIIFYHCWATQKSFSDHLTSVIGRVMNIRVDFVLPCLLVSWAERGAKNFLNPPAPLLAC